MEIIFAPNGQYSCVTAALIVMFEKKRESENSKNSDIVKDRMLRFEDELSHWKEYDYVVTNDNFDNCVLEITNII